MSAHVDRVVLPSSLGVGIYISDSEDSEDSDVERWLAGEDEREETPIREDRASTVYASALEDSVDGSKTPYSDSDSERCFFDEAEEDGILLEADPFPPSLPVSERAERLLEKKQCLREMLLKHSSRIDGKLAVLDAKRWRKCAQIEQDHITRTVTIALSLGEAAQEDPQEIQTDSAVPSDLTQQTHRMPQVNPDLMSNPLQRGAPSVQTPSHPTSELKSSISEAASKSFLKQSGTSNNPETERIKMTPLSTTTNTTEASIEPKDTVSTEPTRPEAIDHNNSDAKREDTPEMTKKDDTKDDSQKSTESALSHRTETSEATELTKTSLNAPNIEPTPAKPDPQSASPLTHPVHTDVSLDQQPMEPEEVLTNPSIEPQPDQVPSTLMTRSPTVEMTDIDTVSADRPTEPTVAQVIPSIELLQRSEQMRIPRTLPPPEALFFTPQAVPVDEAQQIALHAAKSAIEFEAYHRRIAQELLQSMGNYSTDITNVSIRKAIDKRMKLDISQISATESQVHAKIGSILSTLAEVEGTPGIVYACAQLARHLVSKCAGISDLLVFAIAKTAVGVMQRHPQLLSILLSFLHEVSVLTVPKYFSSDDAHNTLLDTLGFRDIPGRDRSIKESEDAFIARQSGYVKFYAALVELNSHVHGLEFGWHYLSRMLNNLPPSRITASALMSFLNVDPSQLSKKQFYKVLLYVHSRFLVKLASSQDIEAQAVYSRLQTYLQNHRFTKPPEGKTLARSAASDVIHA